MVLNSKELKSKKHKATGDPFWFWILRNSKAKSTRQQENPSGSEFKGTQKHKATGDPFWFWILRNSKAKSTRQQENPYGSEFKGTQTQKAQGNRRSFLVLNSKELKSKEHKATGDPFWFWIQRNSTFKLNYTNFLAKRLIVIKLVNDKNRYVLRIHLFFDSTFIYENKG